MACLQKKLIRPWLLRILELSLVENVIAPTSDVHEGSFGLQPMKEEKIYMESTRQVWITLAEIIGELFGTTLEGRPGGMCSGPRETSHNKLFKVHIVILRIFDSKCDCWSYCNWLPSL